MESVTEQCICETQDTDNPYLFIKAQIGLKLMQECSVTSQVARERLLEPNIDILDTPDIKTFLTYFEQYPSDMSVTFNGDWWMRGNQCKEPKTVSDLTSIAYRRLIKDPKHDTSKIITFFDSQHVITHVMQIKECYEESGKCLEITIL